MLLINCKVELSLSWDPDCILTSQAGNSTFAITDAKLYVPAVTLSIEDNAKLKELKDYLFLLMIIQLQPILTEDIFF